MKILNIEDDGIVELDNPEYNDCEHCGHCDYSPADRWSPAELYCNENGYYIANYRYLNKNGEEMGCPHVIGWDVIDKLAMSKEEVERFINDRDNRKIYSAD